MESNIKYIYVPAISYKEYLRVWHGREPSDLGLKAVVDHLKSVDDVDDLNIFEVVDKQKFFLAVMQHGLTYTIHTKTPYTTIMMKNDVTWRDINEDKSVFQPENARRTILVETDVTIDVSVAQYVDRRTNQLTTREEKVIRYAFIE